MGIKYIIVIAALIAAVPMPDLKGFEEVIGGQATCPGGAVIERRDYETPASKNTPFFEYSSVRILREPNPFVVLQLELSMGEPTKVWMDYNRDGIADDTGSFEEIVVKKLGAAAGVCRALRHLNPNP